MNATAKKSMLSEGLNFTIEKIVLKMLKIEVKKVEMESEA